MLHLSPHSQGWISEKGREGGGVGAFRDFFGLTFLDLGVDRGEL